MKTESSSSKHLFVNVKDESVLFGHRLRNNKGNINIRLHT